MGKILITGIAGFIGSHVAEKMLRDGHDVVGIDNFNDFYDPRVKKENIAEVMKTASGSRSDFTMLPGDILDQCFLSDVFSNQKIDSVIHLAAYAGVRPSIENPQLYLSVNVNGTVNILEQMKQHQVGRLVLASSSSVYGNNPKVPFSEKDPVDQAISPYAASKKAAELFCYVYHHLYGISIACIRYFTVYGARQRPDLAIHKFTRLIAADQPVPMYGDGSMARDYTYIDDIVDGTYKALLWTQEGQRFDVFNLGNGDPVRLLDLINMIAGALHKVPSIKHLPEQPGDVQRTYADITQAQSVLGYAPQTGIHDGIKKFVAWYLHH
ncbi:MAG: SDR family NAD(P)-dependent oxidoreductase [Clostridiaceae bacterium]|nr:SDR family NAD(P)-dependent oxidoreductase [Clostridiaceae bacterium]